MSNHKTNPQHHHPCKKPMSEHKPITKHLSIYFSFLVFLMIFVAMGVPCQGLQDLFELWKQLNIKKVGRK
jgi:hypothetical protein